MSTLTVAPTDLIKILNPATATTRASFSRMRRPWLPGYNALAKASAAAIVSGVNAYHPNTAANVSRQGGAGAAAGASPFVYTLPTGAGITLPTSNAAAIVESAAYANAFCLIYPRNARGNAILLERIGTGGANVTRAFWRVETATTFTISYGYSANYLDLPVGWIAEIQIPTAADIVTLWNPAAAGDTVVAVRDFMVSGGTALTGAVTLNRVFR